MSRSRNEQTSPAERPDEEPAAAINRRAFVAGGASLLAMSAADLLVRAATAGEAGLPDPMRVPGTNPRPYGERSPFEISSRSTGASHSLTPLQSLHGIITPSSLHFERHHNGVPAIDPTHHRLLIHGLVHRPWIFTVEEIKRLPSVSRLLFIECSGNTRDGWRPAQDLTVQHTHGLLSTSEWTGVPLANLLDTAGLRPDANWVLAEGSDAAGMARSVPLNDDVLREALVCYGQNGEALRPEQGYPLRLLVPGYEGNVQVKWLRRLKVGAGPFMTRWETSKYTDLMPDGTAYQFSLVMEAKSVITNPSGGQRLTPGAHEIRGLAWSGRGRIARVEVSVDAGRTWQSARLEEPVLPKCPARFHVPWAWTGQDTIVQSRCVDNTGYRQPSRGELLAVRGNHSSYHYNGIQSWRIDRDGRVWNVDV